MKYEYFKYKVKFTFTGDKQYELHSIVGGDEQILKPTIKLLNIQELVNREDVGDLMVNVYVRYNHNTHSYTTLGYEICE